MKLGGKPTKPPAASRPEPQPEQVPGAMRLEDAIKANVVANAPSSAKKASVTACVTEIRRLVELVGQDWEIMPYGSFANGLGTSASTLKCTCFVVGQDIRGSHPGRDAARLLELRLCPVFERHERFAIRDVKFEFGVLILQLLFDGLLNVDVTCYNLTPLSTDRLLYAYANWDWRLRVVVLVAETWCRRVCPHLPADVIAYIVLYALQVHEDVRLPVLPMDAFEHSGAWENDHRVQDLRRGWECSLSSAALLSRFFQFYARDFYWGREVVSIITGNRWSDESKVWKRLSLSGVYCEMLVEHPYEFQRNYSDQMHNNDGVALRMAFENAIQEVSIGRAPHPLTLISNVGANASLATRGGASGREDEPQALLGTVWHCREWPMSL